MALVRVPSVAEQARAVAKQRRRYSIEEKQRLLAEAAQPGDSVAAVALRHGINANMLFTWRRQVQRGELVSRPQAGAEPSFVPVGMIGQPASPIEIELPNGARLRVGSGVDEMALCRLVRALKAAW